MKICSKCKRKKNEKEFSKDKGRKDGLYYYCKECRKENSRKYYLAYAEKINEKARKWAKDNPEKTRDSKRKWRKDNAEYFKQWKKDNPEKVKKNNCRYRKNNPEKIKESSLKYYKANTEKVDKYRRKRAQAIRAGWLIWMINNNYPPVCWEMNYHHPDQETKLFSIGEWISGHPITPENIEILQAELEKCEYLTRSEHTKLHREQGELFN